MNIPVLDEGIDELPRAREAVTPLPRSRQQLADGCEIFTNLRGQSEYGLFHIAEVLVEGRGRCSNFARDVDDAKITYAVRLEQGGSRIEQTPTRRRAPLAERAAVECDYFRGHALQVIGRLRVDSLARTVAAIPRYDPDALGGCMVRQRELVGAILLGRDRDPEARRAHALHVLSLGVAAVVLFYCLRNQWFFGDEWDPIARRAVFGPADLGLLEPHNEHWSTLATVVYRAQLSLFGLRTYWPVALLFIACQLGTAHLLWRVMCRAQVAPMVATALVVPWVLLGAARDDLLYAWNFTFVGAVGSGFAAMLLSRPNGPFTRRDALVCWGFGVAAVMLSGIGLAMVVVIFLTLWSSRGWRVGAAAASVPVLVYAVWQLGWGYSDDISQQLQSTPEFVWRATTYAFSTTIGIGSAGTVVVVALAIFAALDRRRLWSYPQRIAITCALGAIVLYALVGVRRNIAGSLFEGSDRVGRYFLAALPLMLPLVGLALTRLYRRRWTHWAVLGIALTLVMGHQLDVLRESTRQMTAIKQELKRRIPAAVELARTGEQLLEDKPSPEFATDLDLDAALELADSGNLPSPRLRASDRLGAATYLQVAANAHSAIASSEPPLFVRISDATADIDGDCVTITPHGDRPAIRFRYSRPGSVQLVTEKTGFVSVTLKQGEHRGPERVLGSIGLKAGRRHLDVTAHDVTLILRVPPRGATTVCGVFAPRQ